MSGATPSVARWTPETTLADAEEERKALRIWGASNENGARGVRATFNRRSRPALWRNRRCLTTIDLDTTDGAATAAHIAHMYDTHAASGITVALIFSTAFADKRGTQRASLPWEANCHTLVEFPAGCIPHGRATASYGWTGGCSSKALSNCHRRPARLVTWSSQGTLRVAANIRNVGGFNVACAHALRATPTLLKLISARATITADGKRRTHNTFTTLNPRKMNEHVYARTTALLSGHAALPASSPGPALLDAANSAACVPGTTARTLEEYPDKWRRNALGGTADRPRLVTSAQRLGALPNMLTAVHALPLAKWRVLLEAGGVRGRDADTAMLALHGATLASLAQLHRTRLHETICSMQAAGHFVERDHAGTCLASHEIWTYADPSDALACRQCAAEATLTDMPLANVRSDDDRRKPRRCLRCGFCMTCAGTRQCPAAKPGNTPASWRAAGSQTLADLRGITAGSGFAAPARQAEASVAEASLARALKEAPPATMGGAQHSAFKQLRDATAAAAELLPGAILTTSDTAAADTRRQRRRKRTDRAERRTAGSEEPKRKDPRTAANTAKEGLQAQTDTHREQSRGDRDTARMTTAPGQTQQTAATRANTPRRQRAKRGRPLPDETERSKTRTAHGLGRGRGMTFPAWLTLARARPDPSRRLQGRNTTTGAGAAPTVEAPTATTAAAAATAKNSAAGSRKRARTELPAKGATAEKKMAREGAAAAEIEKTAPAARRGPKQPPAPTEQSGATAAKPPVPTTTTARGAAEPREIHLTRPAGWPKRRWRNYRRSHWNRAPKPHP